MMFRLFRSSVFLSFLFLLGGGLVGCLEQVRLPRAPVYPVWSSLKRSFQVRQEEKVIVQTIKTNADALWEQISLAWGIRHPYGRVFFRVEIKEGILRSCALRRSDIHASILPRTAQYALRKKHAKHLHKMFFRRYKSLPVRYGICAYLRRLRWPKQKRSVVINYVLSRKKGKTKGEAF